MNIAEMQLDTMSRKIKRKFTKLLGKVSLVKSVMDNLNIPDIANEVLKDCPKNHEKISNGKAMEVMILNRLVAPMPLYHVEKWVDEDTCVGDLYGLEPGCMNDDRIGDLTDEMNPYLPELWTRFVSKAISKFKIPFDIIYNDLTSLYFEGVYEESDIVDYGYNRDQKPDKKQINLDINANKLGIPLVYDTFEGKTADKSTVINNMEKIINTLKQTEHNGIKPMMVGDRAMLDDKIVIAYHERGDLDYLGTLKLTVAMKKMIANIKDQEFELIDTCKDNGLYYGYSTEWTFSSEGKSFTDNIVVVKSEQKMITDNKQRAKGIAKFQEVLEDLKGKLNRNRYKTIEIVEKRIESLRKNAKYKKYSKYIETIVVLKENKIEISDIVKADLIKEDEKIDGKYIIATSKKDLSPKLMLSIYKVRDISEKDFSILKGPLRIRPIFLHKDKRIESLVFLSMCALLIYSILKQMLLEREMNLTVNQVFNKFGFVSVGYYEFIDGSILKVADDLTVNQKWIFNKLGLPEPSSYMNSTG